MAFFDADRVVAFPPGPGFVPEPGRDHVPGRAPPGRVRRVRVQEMGLQRGGAGGVQAGGLVDHDPGVLPRHRPLLQSGLGQRQGGGQFVGLGQEC